MISKVTWVFACLRSKSVAGTTGDLGAVHHCPVWIGVVSTFQSGAMTIGIRTSGGFAAPLGISSPGVCYARKDKLYFIIEVSRVGDFSWHNVAIAAIYGLANLAWGRQVGLVSTN